MEHNSNSSLAGRGRGPRKNGTVRMHGILAAMDSTRSMVRAGSIHTARNTVDHNSNRPPKHRACRKEASAFDSFLAVDCSSLSARDGSAVCSFAHERIVRIVERIAGVP
jgi:hypothetical protein